MKKSLILKPDRQDLAITLGLLAFTLATRIPFASRMVFEGDSARFALAMLEYDVAQMRPHAPGYILYVAFAKFIDTFLLNAPISLVAVSIISSALTISLLYILARSMYGRSTAIIASCLLLSSPLFWFNGEMALTYSLEGLCSVLFALTSYKTLRGDTKWLPISTLTFAVAIGVRQNMVIFLLPLWLYTLTKASYKELFLSLLIFLLVCLAWFLPMVALSGGWQSYFNAVQAQYKTWVVHPAPFLYQIKGRWAVFSKFMIYSLGLGLLPMIYYLGRFFKVSDIVEDIRLKLILLWFLPAFLFFITVNVFNPGHVIVVLAPLFIYLSESLKGLSNDLDSAIRKILMKRTFYFSTALRKLLSYKTFLYSSVLLLFVINCYIFLSKDTQVSYAAIKNGQTHLTELVSLTKDNFVAEKTIIITGLFNTQAAFYLPDYAVYCLFPLIFSASEVPIEAQNVYVSFGHQTNPKTYWIPTGFKIEPITIPEGIETIIFWEKEMAGYYQNLNRPLGKIKYNGGNTEIYFFNVKPKEKLIYNYHYISIA